MSSVLIRRGGNLIELSTAGGPLEPELEGHLKNILSYKHLHQLRGQDAWDHVTGTYRPTRVEIRHLYTLDGKGRLVCSAGWRYGLEREITKLGHQVEYLCVDPPHPHPDRFHVDWDRVFEKMDLQPKQIEWLSAMEEVEHGLADAPTGSGKTFTIAAYALAHHKARIHVVTEGLDILQRIRNHLTKYIGGVGMVGGGKNTWGRVTCISADSLHKIGEGFDDPTSKRAADVVIFDEVHKAAASTTLMQLSRYKHARMYGFSGSIEGRFDGAERQLEGLFGEIIFALSYQEAQALHMVVPVRVEWIKVKGEDVIANLQNPTARERHGIWRNELRNRAIADKVLEFAPDVQVLILVAKLEHAVQLKQYLPEFRLCYAPPSKAKDERYEYYVAQGMLDPDDEPKMTAIRRDELRKAFEAGTVKKVIATDVWGTGVDFPNLQVLVRADGRASEILDTQLPGRVTRVAGDTKEYGLVIDLLDEWNDTFLRRSNVRKRNYVKKGWTMVGLGTRRMGARAAATP